MANRKLNSIKFPDIADTYILDADKVNFDDSETYASGSVGKALQNKANIDGSYEDLTAGTANQINTSVRANDKTPYIFRTSGGSVDIGDREYINGIVGGTVAWNQQMPTLSGDNMSTNNCSVSYSDGVATMTKTNTGSFGLYIKSAKYFSIEGHKYLFSVSINPPSSNGEFLFGFESLYHSKRIADANKYTTIDTIQSAPAQRGVTLYWYGSSSGASFMAKDYMAIDLTQMFGSTIADYIYSLEQANAGAGVAWFKKLFNKPYYAYNAGELKSVSGLVSHDMVGFNAWDEEWEVGGLDNTGNNTTSTNEIRSKNYIPVIAGTSYCFNSPIWGAYYFYDADKHFVQRVVNFNVPNVFTVPSDCAYMRFYINSSYGTTYKNDICINISWDGSRNGEYEPYVKHSYPLDSDLTLRGIPKLDANNNLYYDGDTYESDGTVTRKYGIVDLGTLNWYYYSEYQMFYLSYAIADKKAGVTNIICSKYPTSDGVWIVERDKICGGNGSNGTIYIRDTSLGTDPSAFKTAMSGVYLVYELATPTTETADAYNGTQIVDDFGTEKFVIDSNTFAVPVGHDTDYPINMVAKLEMAPNSPDGNGDYIVRQTNGMNEYVPLVIEDALPTIPSEAGSYKLTVTVAEGSDPVLSWTAE